MPVASRPFEVSHSLATAAGSCFSVMTFSLRLTRSSVVMTSDTAFKRLGDARRRLGLVDQRQHVLRRVEVLRVLQDDEAVGGDRGVGGEDVTGVDLAVLQGVDRQRAAGVERLEALEGDAVGLRQAGRCRRRASGTPADRRGSASWRRCPSSSRRRSRCRCCRPSRRRSGLRAATAMPAVAARWMRFINAPGFWCTGSRCASPRCAGSRVRVTGVAVGPGVGGGGRVTLRQERPPTPRGPRSARREPGAASCGSGGR